MNKTGTEEIFLIDGILEMTSTSKTDGRVVDYFKEHNVITMEGYTELVNRITVDTLTASIADSWLYQFALGDDVGTGDFINPEAAVSSYTAATQNVVYTVPYADMVVTYPVNGQIVASTTLDGQTIMDTNYPNDVDMRYCSATMLYKNGKTFSYKRFPARALTRQVDIGITWTYTFGQ